MLQIACLSALLSLGCGRLGTPGVRPQEPWSQAELERASREIQVEIEALRGERFREPVSVKLASRADFVAYAKQRQAQFQSPEDMASDETMAKLLGLFPVTDDFNATLMALVESQVGGFYDPASKSFYLMDTMPVSLGGVILSHELGHALDDQLFDLDKTLRGELKDTDSELAYASVVEGSGTAVMQAWTKANLDKVNLAEAGALDAEQQKAMADAPMILWRPLIAAYLQGAAFLNGGSGLSAMAGGDLPNDRITKAFRTRPESTEQILHPESYWDEAKRDHPSRIEVDLSALPSEWKVEAQDTYGEMMTAIVCTPPAGRGGLDVSNPMALMSMDFTNHAATGWDGDRMVLFSKGNARYLLWVTTWDSPRDAGEFFGALSTNFASLESTAKEYAEHSAKPGAEPAGDAPAARSRVPSHAELSYGTTEDVVVLRISAGASKREQREFEKLPYVVTRR